MDLELTGKRAVVTGASQGIGLAVARGLVEEGVELGLVARDRDRLDRVADELRAMGGQVTPVVCDTGLPDSIAAMVATVQDQLGAVDILVNCAAKVNTGPMRDEDLDEHLAVKVKGYLRCARAFAPGMVDRHWGRIISVSGLAARQTGSVVGSVRNVAVAAMTKNLADEYGASGVNCTVVHPGFTWTERTAAALATQAAARSTTAEDIKAEIAKGIGIGRIVSAKEVADVIVFLASPRSVAINGDAVAAGGGARGPIYY